MNASSRPLRVLLATTDFPPMEGGIQLLLSRLVTHATRCSFTVVTFATRAAPREPEALETALPLEIVRINELRDRRAAVLRLNLATLAAARRRRPDVLLAGHIALGPAAIAAKLLWNVPFVQYTHAKELVHHTEMARRVFARADATIAVSSHTRGLVVERGAPEERIALIHPGADSPTDPLGETDRNGPPTIVTVSRMVEEYKGLDVVLRALPLVAARVPDVRWTVIGDGPLLEPLRETARSWGLAERVELTGALSDSERDRRLAGSKVFVMPARLGSTGGEGFGIAYLEAGACGLPSVAGNVGGATEAVINGETGVLVDPTDHVAVADAITDLLLDPKRAASMGDAGRRYAAEHSWQRMAEEVEELLERVARNTHR